MEAWGEEFAGGGVLVRSDNTTAVSVVNKRGTTNQNLGQQLVDACRQHDIDLSAVHILGVLNGGLADRSS